MRQKNKIKKCKGMKNEMKREKRKKGKQKIRVKIKDRGRNKSKKGFRGLYNLIALRRFTRSSVTGWVIKRDWIVPPLRGLTINM